MFTAAVRYSIQIPHNRTTELQKLLNVFMYSGDRKRSIMVHDRYRVSLETRNTKSQHDRNIENTKINNIEGERIEKNRLS